jgi:hypothetical protein
LNGSKVMFDIFQPKTQAGVRAGDCCTMEKKEEEKRSKQWSRSGNVDTIMQEKNVW